jgi:hypothetical protein
VRHAKRVDANHDAIRGAFRACGYVWHDFSGVGHGCPDGVAEKGDLLYWVEIKDGDKVPSRRKLTPKETIWHALLKRSGMSVRVVTSVDDVLALAKESTGHA